jgi:hypothetical protein
MSGELSLAAESLHASAKRNNNVCTVFICGVDVIAVVNHLLSAPVTVEAALLVGPAAMHRASTSSTCQRHE